MALAITATYNNSYHSPGFDLVVTGLGGAEQSLTIERTDSTGTSSLGAVRGADQIDPSGTSFAISDYEMPLNTDLRYKVTGVTFGTPATATSSVVTTELFSSGEVFLRSVIQPALSLRVNMVDWAERSTPGRVLGEYEVLGRRNKVIITDVLSGREGDFSLATFRHASAWESDCPPNELDLLLEEGGTLMIQTPGRNYTGEDDMYLEIKNVQRKRVGVVGAYQGFTLGQWSDLTHLWTISYVEVDRPSTAEESLGLLSWQYLVDDFATWGDVLAAKSNWLDVLDG